MDYIIGAIGILTLGVLVYLSRVLLKEEEQV